MTKVDAAHSCDVNGVGQRLDVRAHWRTAPIAPLSDLIGRGPVLIVAPHPDDEIIGCGGLISLAAEAGIDVRIVILTDGSLSHPKSKLFPPDALAVLRKRECLAACSALGVSADRVEFWNARDGALSCTDKEVDRLSLALQQLHPTAVFTTWIDDPHCDHKAAFEIARSAARFCKVKLFAYPIWSWTIRTNPNPLAWMTYRLDMISKIERKMQAFDYHASQQGKVIIDDPDGCTITDRQLDHMRHLYETFIEVRD